MMYILSQEELDGLVSVEQVNKLIVALATAKAAILQAAGKTCWRKSDSRGYCDDCPVYQLAMKHHFLICTETKEWSK